MLRIEPGRLLMRAGLRVRLSPKKKHCCLGILGPGSGFTPPDGPIAYQDARFRSQDHLSQSLFSDSNMSCGRFLKRYQGF